MSMTLSETITEQIELFELNIRVVRLMVIERQERSFLKPCRTGKLEGCWFCKTKRFILRGRFH